MGCGASKIDLDAFLTPQRGVNPLIEGTTELAVGGRAVVTCSQPLMLLTVRENKFHIKISVDGALFATLSFDGGMTKSSNSMVCGTVVATDKEGKLAAIVKQDKGSAHSFRDGRETVSTVYSASPRHASQAAALTFKETPMYAAAELKLGSGANQVAQDVLKAVGVAVHDATADGGFSLEPSMALKYVQGGWRVLKGQDGLGVASVRQMTLAPGVDPLLCVLAFMEKAAYSELKLGGGA